MILDAGNMCMCVCVYACVCVCVVVGVRGDSLSIIDIYGMNSLFVVLHFGLNSVKICKIHHFKG